MLAAAGFPVTAGTWGDNITWSIKDGVLSLSGEGPMDEADGFSCDLSPEYAINHTNDGVSFSPYPWNIDYYISQEIDAEPAEFSSVVIGAGITSLATGAFYDLDLESVTLPSTLTSIGDFALAENPVLGAVTIPESVTEIGMYAFHATTENSPEDNLPLTIPGSVETIGAFAFSQNRYTRITLSEGLLSIGEGAFFNGTEEPATPTSLPAVRGIFIPASVEKIGPAAFCTAVKGIIVQDGNQYYTDVCGQLYDIGKTFLHTRPRYYLSSEWTSTSDYEESLHMRPKVIGEYAYSCSPTLTQVELPSSVQEIQDNAFADCTALESATFEKGSQLRSIGDSAFLGCPLSAMEVPDGTETIGDYAFWGCQFTNVYLPDSITSLDHGAFLDCNRLEAISLPSALDRIAPELFSGCNQLESVTMGESITSVGERAFYECTDLFNLLMSSSVKSVGDEAFYNCSNLHSLSFPSGLTSIGESAFEGAGLMELSLPDTVTTLGTSAFSGCPMTQASLSAGLTKIPGWAFYNCRNLTELTVPAGVTSIGEQAFSDCKTLAAISLPESVNTIGESAFSGCAALTGLTIPAGVTVIAPYTFRDCAALTELAIPEGITSIGTYAFSGCTQLRSLEMPKTMRTVDVCAFENCSSLEKVRYNSICAAWDKIDIAEEGNQDLRFALITCTDGYYGLGDVGPDENATPDMTAEIFPLGGDWNNMLPLAGSWEGARVEISLNKDWVYTHDDLFSSKFSEFYGTFRILTASGDILYTKPAPLTYYGIVSGVGSITISFNYEEFTQLPLPQDSELTCCLYDYLDRYICSCTIRTSPFQRWSFSNYSKTIPDELVKAVFGSAKGRQLLQAAKNSDFSMGDSGLCFGMAALTSLVNAKYIPATLFRDCEALDQVERHTPLSGATGSSDANDLIQTAHLLQYKESVQKQLNANKGNYEGLKEQIDLYKAGRQPIPLLYIKDRSGGADHTLCAYDYTEDKYYLSFYVYDVSMPTRLGVVKVFLSDNSWNYVDMYWSGSAEMMSFCTVADGVSWIDQGADHALLSTQSSLLVPNKVSIFWISNGYEPTQSTGTDSLYWIWGDDPVTLSGPGSIADDYALYNVTQADSCVFSMEDGEVTQAQVSGETVALSCEYYPDDGDTLVRVTFQGTCAPGEEVSLIYDPETKTVDLTGAGQGTVTVTYDDGDEATEDPSWSQSISGGTVSVTSDGSAAPEIDSGSGGSSSGGSSSGGSSSGGSSSGGSSSGGSSAPETAEPEIVPSYDDVPADHWACEEIEWAADQGYMRGTSASAFTPGGTVSRQQIWMVLARMSGADPANMSQAKEWAVANGISDGSAPGAPVTRQQLAAMLYRYAVARGMAAVTLEEHLSGYPDGAAVSSYAVQAMNWAVGRGIISGMSDGTLNPGGLSNRAQLAVILYRFHQFF